MRNMIKILTGAAGLAALTAAAPAASQYYPYNPYSGYGYNSYNSYGGYGGYSAYGANPSVAASQCTAAVQNRLYNRTSLGSTLGSLIGIPSYNTAARVVSVTEERATPWGMRIRGLASSGRSAYNGYSPYGIGAYGALGYGYNASADLSFKCDVDYSGYVRHVDIHRRY